MDHGEACPHDGIEYGADIVERLSPDQQLMCKGQSALEDGALV